MSSRCANTTACWTSSPACLLGRSNLARTKLIDCFLSLKIYLSPSVPHFSICGVFNPAARAKKPAIILDSSLLFTPTLNSFVILLVPVQCLIRIWSLLSTSAVLILHYCHPSLDYFTSLLPRSLLPPLPSSPSSIEQSNPFKNISQTLSLLCLIPALRIISRFLIKAFTSLNQRLTNYGPLFLSPTGFCK